MNVTIKPHLLGSKSLWREDTCKTMKRIKGHEKKQDCYRKWIANGYPLPSFCTFSFDMSTLFASLRHIETICFSLFLIFLLMPGIERNLNEGNSKTNLLGSMLCFHEERRNVQDNEANTTK